MVFILAGAVTAARCSVGFPCEKRRRPLLVALLAVGALALGGLHAATARPPCRPLDAFGGAALAGAATIGFVGPALAEAAASAGPDSTVAGGHRAVDGSALLPTQATRRAMRTARLCAGWSAGALHPESPGERGRARSAARVRSIVLPCSASCFLLRRAHDARRPMALAPQVGDCPRHHKLVARRLHHRRCRDYGAEVDASAPATLLADARHVVHGHALFQ